MGTERIVGGHSTDPVFAPNADPVRMAADATEIHIGEAKRLHDQGDAWADVQANLGVMSMHGGNRRATRDGGIETPSITGGQQAVMDEIHGRAIDYGKRHYGDK